MIRRTENRAGVGAALLSLALLSCGDKGPVDPELYTVRVSLTVALPTPPASPIALVVPPSVESVVLDVRSPGCEDSSAYDETRNVAGGDPDPVFTFDLTAEATACFAVQAYSDSSGVGTLVFEGETAGVDLTTGGAVSVDVDVGFVDATPATVITGAPTDVTSTTATFNADVIPEGFETVAYFEWGTTTAYGSSTPAQPLGAGVDTVAMSQLVTGLAPGQSYHYRAVGVSSGGRVTGVDQAFSTSAAGTDVTVTFPDLAPPTVTTDSANSTSATEADLFATVNSQGTPTWAHFEWGPDVLYGNTTPPMSVGATSADSVIRAAVSGLTAGVDYHFRAVAYNAGGLTVGPDQLVSMGCTPEGFDIPGNGVDDDCDGTADNEVVCDTGLAMDTGDATEAARAMEMCRIAADASDWGLVSAAWVVADGAAPPTDPTELVNFHLGHGVLAELGSNVPRVAGSNMLALGSGTARAPTDPGYVPPGGVGFAKGYTSGHPESFPVAYLGCPVPGTPNDATGLEVTLRAPDNATGFSFQFKYHTSDYTASACTEYVDHFVAMFAEGAATPTNLAFDSNGSPVTVDSRLFMQVCSAGGDYTCPLGPSELVGTGFDSFAATMWETVSGPVTPGAEITLRLVIYDSGDGASDATVLLDNFRWTGG